MENYFEQAVSCVEDYVLPMQRQIYEKCGGDFDRIYSEAMKSDWSGDMFLVPSS